MTTGHKFTENRGEVDARGKSSWKDQLHIQFRDDKSALRFAQQILSQVEYGIGEDPEECDPVTICLHGELLSDNDKSSDDAKIK